MSTPPSPTVAPATGRLGVLTVGLGAVASTLIAGVELVKRGMGLPIDYRRLREVCQTDVDGSSIDKLEELAVQLGVDAEQMKMRRCGVV